MFARTPTVKILPLEKGINNVAPNEFWSSRLPESQMSCVKAGDRLFL